MSRTSRFERCKTPSGSIPISVIMGFEYPLADQYSGRGENGMYGSCLATTLYSSTPATTYSNSSRAYNYSSLNSNESDKRSNYSSMKFLNTILSDDKNTMNSLDSWGSRDVGYRANTPVSREEEECLSRSRYVRAQTEARELLRSSRDRYVQSCDPREHPRQQSCRYPRALSEYTSSSQRNIRAKTVAPMVVSPARHHSSFISNHRMGWGSSASRNYFSSVRSRFL